MRIIIDTELNKIIVPDSFFNQIDKMNKVLAENKADKTVDYVQYIKGSFEKAIKEVNKDIKVLKQFTNSFTDAAKGRVVAEQMVNEKADILFMASGGGNNGILEVVKNG